MAKIPEKLKHVTDTINDACDRAGRDPSEITLVIVTKSAAVESIEQVIELGFTVFGENRVQRLKRVSMEIDEFLRHADEVLPEKVDWHMIGHLQRNKVQQVLKIVSLIHSVDTLRLAEEINTTAGKLNLRSKVLLQINTSLEPQKYGVPVGAAVHLAEQMQTLPNLTLAGLMVMAPLTKDKKVITHCFTRARELFVEIKGEKIVGPEFTELSMGMSSDYEIAIEQGSTILRIGSAVFAG